MSNFDIAYSQVVALEGTYSMDPNDTGGETVFGISRNNFPKWSGWETVDRLKNNYAGDKKAFLAALNQDMLLSIEVKNWYKKEFWDKFDLDSISNYSLSYEIFDQAVNLGVSRTTGHIQLAINALNYNHVFGADLVVDRKIGPMTRLKLTDVGNNVRYTEALRKALDGLQVNHYITLGTTSNSKSDYRKYTRGWLLNRVGKYNEQGQAD